MKTWKQSAFFGMVVLLTITLVLTACGDGGGSNNDNDDDIVLPASVGTNEVLGKTLYLRSNTIVFNTSETTFKCYTGYFYYGDYEDDDDYDYDYEELDSEGSYSYNSKNKTITLAISYVYWFGTKMNRTQAVNAYLKKHDDWIARIKADLDTYLKEEGLHSLLPEEFWDDYYDYDGSEGWDEFAVDWMDENDFDINAAIREYKTQNGITDADSYINKIILVHHGFPNLNDYRAGCMNAIERELALATYDYQFSDDGKSLLVQQKLPANKGTNELKGKDFICEWTSEIDFYTFSASDNNYTATSDSQIVEMGTYAYDSINKDVYLRPEKVDEDQDELQTILEYYDSYAGYDFEDAASWTNGSFSTKKLKYRLDPNNDIRWFYIR